MSLISLAQGVTQQLDEGQLPLTSFGNEPFWLTIAKTCLLYTSDAADE